MKCCVVLSQSIYITCIVFTVDFIHTALLHFLSQFVPKQKLNLVRHMVPSWLLLLMQEAQNLTETVRCSIPTFDPSVQHCMARKIFFAHECLGALFTFIWLGSLMNILDVHNEAGSTVERLATVLACIAVLSCRSNSD